MHCLDGVSVDASQSDAAGLNLDECRRFVGWVWPHQLLVALGATRDGRLTAIRHATVTPGSFVGNHGAIGIGAAIANAVFHAMGVRVRELPIRPEHLLRPPA